jgi:hypothetical protein
MSYEEYSRTIKSYSDWLRATSDVDGLRNYHKVYVELFPQNDDNGKIKENPEIRTYLDFVNNVRLEFSHDSRESYFDMYGKFFPGNDDINTPMKWQKLKNEISQGNLPAFPAYLTVEADAGSDDSNYDLESFNDYSGLYPELGESRKMETKEDDDFEYDGDEKGIELKPLLKKPNGGGRRTRRTRRTRRNKSKKSRKTKKPRKYRKSRKPRK